MLKLFKSAFKLLPEHLHLWVLLLLVISACARVALWQAEEIDPICSDKGDVALTGQINSARPNRPGRFLTDMTITAAGTPGCENLIGRRVRIHLNTEEELHPGAIVTGTARLRQPWGSSNPGGFDYQRWLQAQRFVASGYMRRAILIHAGKPGFGSVLNNYVNGGLLRALVLGERSGVSAQQWALFRGTGTIHLMVISGLHVGIFSGLFFALAFGLLRVMPATLRCGRPKAVAMLIAVCCAALFAFYTGGQPPVLRAVSMAALAALLLTSMRANGSSMHGLAIIGATTLCIAPNFALQQGFWLSYLAVAVLLLYFGSQHRRLSAVRALLACQIVLFAAITPWVGFFTGFVPFTGVLANLVVVPFMSLFVIPIAMSGVALAWMPALSHILLTAADLGLAIVLEILQTLHLQPNPGLGPVDPMRLLLAVVAATLIILPIPIRFRLLSVFGWLPLLLPVPSEVAHGEFAVTVLDVGQGSAAVIDTRTSRTLVDAGVSYAGGFDAGASIVLPALRATGPDRLDHIVLSHLDSDHAGGMGAVAGRFPGVAVLGLDEACPHNRSWRQDGVELRLLTISTGVNRNDRSCTVLVRNHRHSAYLSGDISSAVEAQLLTYLPRNIDLLVAPHHGSASSSSPPFVRWLAPRHVIFSAARFNRYQHPRAKIVARYARIGSTVIITGWHGAARWYSGAAAGLQTMRGTTELDSPDAPSAQARE